MRLASLICLTLTILGCSPNSTQQHSPTAPTPPVVTAPPAPAPTRPPQASNLVTLWGYVVTASGNCIEGATVEVLAGPVPVGRKATQKTCDFEHLSGGFMFDEGVPATVPITMRASAPGFSSQERIWDDYWEYVRFTLVPTGRRRFNWGRRLG